MSAESALSEKPIEISDTTERAIVLRERAAAARARCDALYCYEDTDRVHFPWKNPGVCVECAAWSLAVFPLPQRQTVRYEPDDNGGQV